MIKNRPFKGEVLTLYKTKIEERAVNYLAIYAHIHDSNCTVRYIQIIKYNNNYYRTKLSSLKLIFLRKKKILQENDLKILKKIA